MAPGFAYARVMIEHRYHLDLPHERRRVWALMNDYPRWVEFAPMVLAVEVVFGSLPASLTAHETRIDDETVRFALEIL